MTFAVLQQGHQYRVPIRMLYAKRSTLVEEVTLLSNLSLVLLVNPAFRRLHHQMEVCV